MVPDNTPPPDWWSFTAAAIIAVMSGFISIAQRIVRGTRASVLWITSEYTAAFLSAWIAYDAYPILAAVVLPEWVTMLMVVAAAAHFGGRTFQAVENLMYQKYGVRFDHQRSNKSK